VDEAEGQQNAPGAQPVARAQLGRGRRRRRQIAARVGDDEGVGGGRHRSGERRAGLLGVDDDAVGRRGDAAVDRPPERAQRPGVAGDLVQREHHRRPPGPQRGEQPDERRDARPEGCDGELDVDDVGLPREQFVEAGA
jgi:hypothetical protein